jgi:hypothetical protein
MGIAPETIYRAVYSRAGRLSLALSRPAADRSNSSVTTGGAAGASGAWSRGHGPDYGSVSLRE